MKNSCIRSGFLRQILIWLMVQTSQYVFFEEKASRTRGDHLWQSYSFICEYMGLVFAFLKLPVILFSKLELVRWNLAESRKVFPTRCVISLCFDVELLQNLLEASTLPLIYFRMSHSREAFCRRGVSTFHRKGFFKGTVSGARKPVALRMQCDGSRMWGKENR